MYVRTFPRCSLDRLLLLIKELPTRERKREVGWSQCIRPLMSRVCVCVCVCVCVYVCVSPSNLQAGSNLVVGVVHLQHGRQTQQAKLADHTKLAHGQLINREMPAKRDAKGMCMGVHTVKCQFVSTNTYICTYVCAHTLALHW